MAEYSIYNIAGSPGQGRAGQDREFNKREIFIFLSLYLFILYNLLYRESKIGILLTYLTLTLPYIYLYIYIYIYQVCIPLYLEPTEGRYFSFPFLFLFPFLSFSSLFFISFHFFLDFCVVPYLI